jgi:hypothetical protein
MIIKNIIQVSTTTPTTSVDESRLKSSYTDVINIIEMILLVISILSAIVSYIHRRGWEAKVNETLSEIQNSTLSINSVSNIEADKFNSRFVNTNNRHANSSPIKNLDLMF